MRRKLKVFGKILLVLVGAITLVIVGSRIQHEFQLGNEEHPRIILGQDGGGGWPRDAHL